MNCVPESCPCKKIGFPNCVTNCIKGFYINIYIYIYRILYIYNIRYHPPSSTLLASAIAFNKYPHTINRTFSKGLIVPNYYLFLLKNQNINAIQKQEAFLKVGVTVNLSPDQPKVNGSQLRSHSLLKTFD